MYTRMQLHRYANQIDNQEDARAFNDALDAMKFDGEQFCPAHELEQAMSEGSLAELRKDFQDRHHEFLIGLDFQLPSRN